VSSALMSDPITALGAVGYAATAASSAAMTAVLIVVLRPWLQRYALARPNARSSHRIPTPQGGGIAVIAATIAAASAAGILGGVAMGASVPVLFAAAIVMACVGAVDDIRPLAVAPRLLLQALAVAAVFHVLPDDLRVVPILPWWIERVLLVVGGVWFINLVNFMDGIDWMTVAEAVPITAALAAIGMLGALPSHAIVVALALGGAMIGFAYFNRPVAKLFLGDVGSLPLGLLLGWLLVLLAGERSLAAAVLLPLYYLADSTITLLQRLLRREKFWQAHRTHFYQRATDRGFTPIEVVTRVFTVNLVLAALALATVMVPEPAVAVAALICGAAIVAWLLLAFARGRK
jgi:UDP-N-acetylmuramyl pentapeptide phosphotransferase/UDP-N-acetylglucosamine-1-phosphate transferase